MLLDGISTPQDLKKLKIEELPKLAAEIRQTLAAADATGDGQWASAQIKDMMKENRLLIKF